MVAINLNFLTDSYQTNFLCVVKKADFEYTITIFVGLKQILKTKWRPKRQPLYFQPIVIKLIILCFVGTDFKFTIAFSCGYSLILKTKWRQK